MDISEFDLDNPINQTERLSKILDKTSATTESLLKEINSEKINLYYHFEFKTKNNKMLFVIPFYLDKIENDKFIKDSCLDLFIFKSSFPKNYWKPILRKHGPLIKFQSNGKTPMFQLAKKKTIPLSEVLIYPRHFYILMSKFKELGFILNTHNNTIGIGDKIIKLSLRQFKLLKIMIQLTKDQNIFTPHDLSRRADYLFHSESQKITDIFPKNTKNGLFINSNILIKVSRGKYKISLYNSSGKS